MKIPRDVAGSDLVKALRILGYSVTRQKSSHICITTQLDGENLEVIPSQRHIKTGSLSGILKRSPFTITHSRTIAGETRSLVAIQTSF